MPRLGFKGPHSKKTKDSISKKLNGKRPGGFNVKKICEYCNEMIAIPNFKRHQIPCKKLCDSKHVFSKEMNLRQIKSFKTCLSQYKLSIEDYIKIFNKQNGLCFICLKKQETKRLFVDHCHVTKKVRALLCYHCNTMLGMCKEDVSILESAIRYLKDAPYKD